MRYISTRGGVEEVTFESAVFRGLAPDGGLYIPTYLPELPADWQTAWANLPFAKLAFCVLSLFIPATIQEGGIPRADLLDIVERSFSTFRCDAITPLHRVNDQQLCLELWHGPTFAFKDVALQTLGNLFEYFLARRNAARGAHQSRHQLTVLGATSGDTGSAAIHGLRSKKDIDIFILHPKGRVSPIQELQMTTVLDDNVHNVALEGTFDDCQDVVKALFSDLDFKVKYNLAAVNSINIARIIAQIVYYFWAYFQYQAMAGVRGGRLVQFVVPTGNFGDVLAGYYAKRLGLPMDRLAIATNENDILPRFWATGRYETRNVTSSGGCCGAGGSHNKTGSAVKATLSPSMDISVSSNFERLLWYIALEAQGDAKQRLNGQPVDVDARIAASKQVQQWMQELRTAHRVVVNERQLALARRDFVAERVSDEQTKQTIAHYFTRNPPSSAYLIDPHTAVGFHAANRLAPPSEAGRTVQIVLGTAHPAKFPKAIKAALGEANISVDFERDIMPRELADLSRSARKVEDVKLSDAANASAPFDQLVQATRQIIERSARNLPMAMIPEIYQWQ